MVIFLATPCLGSRFALPGLEQSAFLSAAPSARGALEWFCLPSGGMLLLGGKSAPNSCLWVALLRAPCRFARVCAACRCIPACQPREAEGLGSSPGFLQLGFHPRRSLGCVFCQSCPDKLCLHPVPSSALCRRGQWKRERLQLGQSKQRDEHCNYALISIACYITTSA